MLGFQQIVSRVREHLGAQAVLEAKDSGLHPSINVGPDFWHSVADFLAHDPETDLSVLRCITGLDYPDRRLLCAVYDLLSYQHRHTFCVKVFVPHDAPLLPSVAAIWRSADWHEREAYDMFGLVFTGHPDSVTDGGAAHPRRILLPDDWEGFPLRKDYQFPREYHGIPGSVELDWAQKPDYPA